MTTLRRARRQNHWLPAAIALGLALALAPSPVSRPALALVPLHANDDTLSTRHDRLATVAAPGVLGNDLGIGSGTAALENGPNSGTLTFRADGSYTYRPTAGFVGADTFTYHDVGLLGLKSNTATVTITITNAAPIAVDDSYSAVTGVQLTVPAPGVLANDHDADGDSLSASLVSGGGNGSFSLAANGGFTFKSGGSFTGVHTFTYRVSDGIISSGIATLSIDVMGSSPTPTPTPTATPTPPPTPTPTLPLPTLPLPTLPLPTLPLPTLPLPTLPLPTLPLPTPPGPTPTPSPGSTPRPTPPAGSGATPSASSDATPTPTPLPGTSSNPSASSGPGGDPSALPGSTGTGTGGPPDRGPFTVGRDGLGSFDGLTGLNIVGFDGLIEWAVPALVLSVPGLLLLLAVLAQAGGGLLWLPVIRRWLGGFGFRRRRSADAEAA